MSHGGAMGDHETEEGPSPWLLERLACPRDGLALARDQGELVCSEGHRYPVWRGVPVLLLEEAAPTLAVCSESLERARSRPDIKDDRTVAVGSGVDPWVQEHNPQACGYFYVPVVGRMHRYPIPTLGLENHREAGDTFLDIGCSWGRWCISATREGYRAVGIDPSLDAVLAARRVARQLGLEIDYVVGDARHLPFRSGAFSVVFAYSVFQYFDQDDFRLAVAAAGRVLKGEGLLVSQMAHVLGLRNLFNRVRRWFRRLEAWDVHYWSIPCLRSTCIDLLGPTTVQADSYFSMNAQMADVDLLPLAYRGVVRTSDLLCRLSKIRGMGWLKYGADSVKLTSVRR